MRPIDGARDVTELNLSRPDVDKLTFGLYKTACIRCTYVNGLKADAQAALSLLASYDM